MDGIKKPFACPIVNCDMSFVNEDHLSVHKKKHELCLTLTPTSAFRTAFIDQTPTPTRFLNALESEIFQELQNDNPFEATFRKANSLSVGSHDFAIPESSSLLSSLPDSEVLNTPSITLPSEPQTPLAIRRKASVKADTRNILLSETFGESNDTLPFTPTEKFVSNEQQRDNTNEQQQQCETIPAIVNSTCDDTFNIIEGGIQKQSAIRTSVVQTPVITSVGNSTSPLKQNAIGVPTAVVVTRAINDNNSAISSTIQQPDPSKETSQIQIQETNQAIVQSVSVTPMVQLLIRLPDGQTMPVQIPVMASTSKPVQTVTNLAPQLAHTTSLAKMKLKEVLTSGQKSGNRKKSVSSGKGQTKQHIRVLPASDILDDFSYSLSPPLSPNQTSRLDANGRRRRDSGGNSDEKRKKCLERNRAAATRCRQKRKQWIEALEKKADELAVTNVHLQQEVSMLRNEVTQLKTMLLAHKDCPVTLQQRASSMSQLQRDPLTVQILSSIQTDANSGPLPLNVELMEMEVSSSHSGNSEASISSDTSEVSCKER